MFTNQLYLWTLFAYIITKHLFMKFQIKQHCFFGDEKKLSDSFHFNTQYHKVKNEVSSKVFMNI